MPKQESNQKTTAPIAELHESLEKLDDTLNTLDIQLGHLRTVREDVLRGLQEREQRIGQILNQPPALAQTIGRR